MEVNFTELEKFDSNKLKEHIKTNHLILSKIEENSLSLDKITLQEIISLFSANSEDLWNFVKFLLHTNNDELAIKLLPEKVRDLIDLRRCYPKNGFISEFSFGENNSKDLLIEPKEKNSDFYNMESDPRGLCILINNYFTTGTYKEMNRFRNIFYQLHFDVVMEKNLTEQQIKELLIKTSKEQELEKHNAFVFMIITHGTQNDEILGFDGKPIKIRSLVSLFNNTNCASLQGKPKMFFFNCCRGDKYDYGIESGSALSKSKGKKNRKDKRRLLPEGGDDWFICYSTMEGYVAHVNSSEGTKFGKTLADAFVERATTYELNAIIRKAKRDLKDLMKKSKVKQTFEWIVSTDKQVLFNPSIPYKIYY